MREAAFMAAFIGLLGLRGSYLEKLVPGEQLICFFVGSFALIFYLESWRPK